MDKSKKYNLFFAIFIMSILVFSILGYSIKGDNPNTIKYKDIKFTKNNQGFYTARINDRLISLSNNPKDLEDIPIQGRLNATLFNSEKAIYITFDPLGQNLKYVALAVGEFDQNIIKAFGKMPIAACDKNETKACSGRPIITCNNTDKPVLYLQQKPETKVIYDNNCMIVQGIGAEIVRAVDRLLLKLYGIMQ